MTGNSQGGKKEKEARNDSGSVQGHIARDLEQLGVVEDSLPMVGSWKEVIFMFPSHPNYSMIP